MPKPAPRPTSSTVLQRDPPATGPIRRRATPAPEQPAASTVAAAPPPPRQPAAPAAPSDHRTIQTARFGTLDIPRESILTFPVGIPGFPTSTAFVLLEHRPGSRFRWLQCVDLPELAVIVIDPLLIDPDYPTDEVRRALAFCKLDEDEDVAVLVICSIPPPPAEVTANLLAPLGVGLHSRRGAQVVIHERGFDVRTPVSLLPR